MSYSSRLQWNREREQLRATMSRGDFAEERMGVGVVDNNWQVVADLPGVALENDDTIAMRAPRELEVGTGGWGLGAGGRLFFGGFAGAFHQDLDLLADEGMVVGLADFVLESQQFMIALAFDFVGNIVGVQLGAL